MSGIERGPRRGDFPRSWGVAPPLYQEAERAGWVAANLSADLMIQGRSGEVRALMPNCEVRDVPPAIRHRLRLLELLARQLPPA